MECTLSSLGDQSSVKEEAGDEAGNGDLCWEDGGLPVELQRGMETLRVNRELTDVTLCVQGQEFPCHRAVLAAASQYFR